jgi:NAD(P)H dehydrogenase (quinone)
MNQLIIVAHPKNDSFSQEIKREIEKNYIERGGIVKIRDLYSIDFQAILSKEELKHNKEGKTYPDIVIEQDYITWADGLTIIYPLWWNGFPAILKGYVDRVFTNGFAFKINGKGPEGLLKDKKVRLITTAGMTEESLMKSNIYEGLRITQEHGVFEFCGMEVLEHLYITRVTSLSNEEKKEEMRKLIQKVL